MVDVSVWEVLVIVEQNAGGSYLSGVTGCLIAGLLEGQFDRREEGDSRVAHTVSKERIVAGL